MNNDEPHAAISAAAASKGMAPPDYPLVIDGSIKRYHDHANDRPGVRNAWYIGHHNPDGTTGGTIGSNKLQVSCPWITSQRRTFTPAEKAEFARQQAAARLKAEADRLKRHADAAVKAGYLWKKARPADLAHPYIIRKGIQPHRARQTGTALVLDYRNDNGIITTLQFIQLDGEKRFLSGGEVTGSFHRFGGHPPFAYIILAEGFATGCTLHEATGHPVAVCGSAGNMAPVALGIRAKFPGINIIVAGDADPVGAKAATDAAELVNGIVCLPDFEGAHHGR